MTRRLIDYKKLDENLTRLFLDTYPYGYGDEDIISFKNQYGETIEAVTLQTPDALYLVKISKSLTHFIANFEEHLNKELQQVAAEAVGEGHLEDTELNTDWEDTMDL